MLTVLFATFAVASCGWAQALTDPGTPREKTLPERIFSKQAIAGSVAGALFGEIVNRPEEWGQGPGGFAQRVGSSFGKHAIRTSVGWSVASLRHEELDYRRSQATGFGPRLKHAVISTFVTRKTTTGEPTIALGQLTGAAAGGFISRLWYPARYHTFASGAGSMGVSLAADTGFHVLREFWPKRRSKPAADVDPKPHK